MRTLFYKLYFLLTGPMYRRLHRELSMQLQEVVRANIEHHEATSKKILDELLRLSYVVEGGDNGAAGPSVTLRLSDSQVADVIKDIDSSLGALEVCHKHELPLTTVFQLRSKFGGMNLSAIQRTKQLESEKEELSRQMEILRLENQRLSAVKQHSSL
jgi:putative transposase